MKPTKNRVYCNGCRHPKMLFAHKKKADNFIRFNAELIYQQSGYRPVRSYYCTICNGWHVTSKTSGVDVPSKKLTALLYESAEQFASTHNRLAAFRNARLSTFYEHLEAIDHQIRVLARYKEYKHQNICRLILNLSFSDLANARQLVGNCRKIVHLEDELTRLQLEVEALGELQSVA